MVRGRRGGRGPPHAAASAAMAGCCSAAQRRLRRLENQVVGPSAASATPLPPCPVTGTNEGWAELRARFQLEEGYTQLNHGSFGCCPTEVADTQVQLLRRAESNPDRWIGHHGLEHSYHPLLNAGRARLAAHVKADVNDLVLCENASAGINAVLRGRQFSAGEKLLYLDVAYGAVHSVVASFSRDYLGAHMSSLP
eukprot:SAG22_NODE_738_length_7524_cov_57.525522_7_plen_195_part_00